MTKPTTHSGSGEPPTAYIAIIEVTASMADSVLEELTREGIAAYGENAASDDPTASGDADASARGVRIHVDRTRVPMARAIIASRLPQVGSGFLSPPSPSAPELSTEEVDRAWTNLIRGWEPDEPGARGGSGLSQRLIRRHGPGFESPGTDDPTIATGPAASPAPAGPRDYAVDHDLLDDEGFVPPEPPPLPRPRHTLDIVGWSAAIGGPAVLVANQVLSWGPWLSGVGVAAFMGGFVLLVSRMRSERDHDDPGAVV